MDLNFICSEIEPKRGQIARHRKEILDLQRSGVSTRSAEELLVRMQAKIDGLCEERDRLVREQRRKYSGPNKVIQRADREALPPNTYRRILRAADRNFPHWVALPEEKCIGAYFHKIRRFCDEHKLSLSRHGHSVTWRHESGPRGGPPVDLPPAAVLGRG